MRLNWHAPWWAWLVALTVCAACMALGNWQLQRAAQKRSIIQAFEQRMQQPARALQAQDTASLLPLHVRIHGYAQTQRQLLLDSQVRNGRRGYDVWLPVLVPGLPGMVLVNRGWVAAPAYGQGLPAVALDVQLNRVVSAWQGLWRALPQAGLRLGENRCDRDHWPHVVQYPTQQELECLLGAPVMNGVLLLDPAAKHGFVRDWRRLAVSMPPSRHLGYAVQWLVLAGVVLVVFYLVNRRKSA